MSPGTKEYQRIHYWVRKELGTPSICEHCKTDSAKKFEWANISHEYKYELSDWMRLCNHCHHLYDSGRTDRFGLPTGLCKNGHDISGGMKTYANNKQKCPKCASVSQYNSKIRGGKKKVPGHVDRGVWVAAGKKRPGDTSMYKGVFKKDEHKWRAAYTYKGKRHVLGTFKTEEDAAKAYLEATNKAYGFNRTLEDIKAQLQLMEEE